MLDILIRLPGHSNRLPQQVVGTRLQHRLKDPGGRVRSAVRRHVPGSASVYARQPCLQDAFQPDDRRYGRAEVVVEGSS